MNTFKVPVHADGRNADMKTKLLFWLLRFSGGKKLCMWLLLQHSLLATSSIAFLHAVNQSLVLGTASHVGSFLQIAMPFLLFYTSTVLPQFPRARYSLALQSLQIEVAQYQQKKVAKQNYANIWAWSDPTISRAADAAYATQLPEATRSYVAQASETSSRVISLLVHSMTLSYLTSFATLVAFLISGVVTVIAMRLYRPSEKMAADSEQTASGALATIRSRFSDAVLRGESAEHNIWQGHLADATKVWASKSYEMEILLSNHAKNTSVLCGIPIFLTLLWEIFRLTYIYSAPKDLSFALVSLFSLVPRILFNLEHGITLINQWPRAAAARTRLAAAEASFLHLTGAPRDVAHEKLTLRQYTAAGDDLHIESEAFLNNDNLSHKTGRYILQGPNGAGKTTFLLHLKQKFKDSCVYVSAVDRDAQTEAGSTGERLVARMDLLFHQAVNQRASSYIKFFLLDEWNAHLDSQKEADWHLKIDEIAKYTVVVEVRHFKSFIRLRGGGND